MGDVVPLRRVVVSPAEMSDEALVSAAGARDPVALGALFDRFHLDVWRFLHRVAGRPEADLDDLVQMTFVEVFRAAPRFSRRSAVKTWIFGIAVNVARNHARSEDRHRAAIARMAEAPQRRVRRPDSHAEESERLEQLARALDELPHDLRVAYVLCVIEELPAQEAARAVGARTGTVWRRVHEARQMLQAALERSNP
jgi:RNA polymerase sigma-70 factor (ECF subfamily)